MTMVGHHTLDLYCDNQPTSWPMTGNHTPDNYTARYTGKTLVECQRKARADGWLVTPDKQLCPLCSGKKGERK